MQGHDLTTLAPHTDLVLAPLKGTEYEERFYTDEFAWR